MVVATTMLASGMVSAWASNLPAMPLRQFLAAVLSIPSSAPASAPDVGLMATGSASTASTPNVNCPTTAVVGGTAANDARVCIQAAITAAPSGGTLIFPAATYNILGTITINKPLTLLGAQTGVLPTGTTRSGGETAFRKVTNVQYGASWSLVRIQSSNVVLDGFEVGDDASNLGQYGIDTTGNNGGVSYTNITISHNWVHMLGSNRAAFAIGLNNSNFTAGPVANLTIANNYITVTAGNSLNFSGKSLLTNLSITGNYIQNSGLEVSGNGGRALFHGGVTNQYLIDTFTFSNNVVKGGIFNIGNISNGTVANNIFDAATTAGGGTIGISSGRVAGNTFANGADLAFWGKGQYTGGFSGPGFTRTTENVVIENNLFGAGSEIELTGANIDLSTITLRVNRFQRPAGTPAPTCQMILNSVDSTYYWSVDGYLVSTYSDNTTRLNALANYWDQPSGTSPSGSPVSGDFCNVGSLYVSPWMASYENDPAYFGTNGIYGDADDLPGFWPVNATYTSALAASASSVSVTADDPALSSPGIVLPGASEGTTVTIQEIAPASIPDTTGVFSVSEAGTVVVDISVSGFALAPGQEYEVCFVGQSPSKIYHYTEDMWVALSPLTYADGKVCGKTTSLSPFGFDPAPTTTTSLTQSAASSSYGDTVAFTATVTESDEGIASGTVKVLDGPTEIGSCTLNGAEPNTCAVNVSTLSAGSRSITAAYQGDSLYSGSSSAAVTHTVSARTLTVTADDEGITYGDAAPVYTFTVTGFAGSDDFTTYPTCSSAYTTGNGAGVYAITCSGGVASSNYATPFTFVAGALTVSKRTLTVTADSATIAFGDAAPTYTASADFYGTDSFTTSPTCTATYTAGAAAGSYPISCSGGTASSNYDTPFTYVDGTLTVQQAGTTTSVSSSVNPSTYLSSVTFTVSVSSAAGTPDGSVTVKADGTSIGTCTLSAGSCTVATSSLLYGTRSITAEYAGSTSFAASTSTALSQVVKALPTAFGTAVGTVTGGTATVTLTGKDVKNTDLTFAIAAGPTHGSVSTPGTAVCSGTDPKTCTVNVTYTPDPGYFGTDSFTFTANDGVDDSNTATVELTVSQINTRITGTIGATGVDTAATAPTFYLRHVGQGANLVTTSLGNNYRATYQKANPRIIVHPEVAPVQMRGTIDLSAQPVGSVGLLGFIDARALANGGKVKPDGTFSQYAGYQSGVFIYIYRTSTGWQIAPSDGNLGGDLSQVSVTIATADMPADKKLAVAFTVDGTAIPDTCNNNAPGTAPAGSQGCLTLTVSGQTGGPQTVKDSYGAVKANTSFYPNELYSHDEFQYGAVPGWDDYLASAVAYDVAVDVDNVAPSVSNLSVTPDPVVSGQSITISADAVASRSDEVIKSVEYKVGTGSWTAMTLDSGSTYTATPTISVTTPGSVAVCVRATDGLSTTTGSDETSDGTSCANVFVKGATTLTLASSVNPSTYGDDVVFTATIDQSAATGTVTVKADGAAIGTCALDGTDDNCAVTTAGLDAGTYSVTAEYDGDDNYDASSAATAVTQVVNQRSLTVTATGLANDKVYDGTTAATVTGTLSDNRVAGDTLTVSYTSATFDNINVGTDKTVTFNGVSVSGADAGNYVLSATPVTDLADITARTVTLTADNKTVTYGDAAPDYTFTAVGFVSPDSFVGGEPECTSTYGPTTPVSASPVTISCSGAFAGSNYTFEYVDGTVTINQKPLTVLATGVGRVYNGTTTATVTLATEDVINSDVVTLAYTDAAFDTKNVGTDKSISVSGIAISGDGAGNYALQNTTASTTATVTAAQLTVTATGLANDKTYDGTTAATVTGTLSDNRVAGDDVTVSYTDATFDTKDAGDEKTVTLNGVTIAGGADAGNYYYDESAVTDAADITAKALTVTADNKTVTYGDAAPTYTFTVGGFVSPDGFGEESGPACTSGYTTSTPVSASPVTISCTGGDAGANYTVSYVNGAVTINKKALTVMATGVGRVYNGTTTATVTLATEDVINGDVVDLAYTGATFTDGKNVGVNKPIAVAGISIGGAGSNNYALQNTTASATATVTQAPLTIAAVTDTKTYDGTASSNKTPLVTGLQNGDTVTGRIQVFDSADAGSRTLEVSAYTVNDGNSGGNYTVTTTTATGTITAAGFTILYTGGTYFAPSAVPASIAFSAQVNVASTACFTSGTGGVVSYTFKKLYSTATADNLSQTINLNGTGTTRTASSTTSLTAGLWEVTATYAAAGNCIPEPGGLAFDTAVVAVVGPGDSSNGGGWYRYDPTGMGGSPRINFGYTVGKSSNYDRKTGQTTTTWRGQILWHNNGQYRFKGQTFAQVVTQGTTWISGTAPYGTVSCPTTFTGTLPAGTSGQLCGAFTGTGQVEQWDSETSTWVPTSYGTVNFTANMYDSGGLRVCKTSKGKTTCTTSENYLDQFGIQFEQLPSTVIRESIPQVLRGGSLKVNP